MVKKETETGLRIRKEEEAQCLLASSQKGGLLRSHPGAVDVPSRLPFIWHPLHGTTWPSVASAPVNRGFGALRTSQTLRHPCTSSKLQEGGIEFDDYGGEFGHVAGSPGLGGTNGVRKMWKAYQRCSGIAPGIFAGFMSTYKKHVHLKSLVRSSAQVQSILGERNAEDGSAGP